MARPGLGRNLLAAMAALAATSCTHMFYNPDHVIYYPPEKTGFAKEDLFFDSLDGTKLHGWFFHSTAAGKPKGTIVHFHGNSRNMTSMYMMLAWVTGQGYNLFSFDYRGYGDSQGHPDEAGTYQDGLAALNLAWQLHQKNDPAGTKFVVYAHSLGGVIAQRAFVDFAHQDGTSLLVLDSTFMSYRDMAQGMLARRWMTWPMSPLAQVFVSDAYASKPFVSRLKTPVLVSHDRHDPIVPFGQGEELYQAVLCKKFFWEKDRGAHAGIFSIEENKMRFIALLDTL